MILGQITYLDCLAFLVFLAPQLLLRINIFELLYCVLSALPFFLVQLPYQLILEHYILRKNRQSPFVKQATLFEDFVIRCVRHAFARFPAKIGRVFFSKPVALPFLRFRMLRQGYLRSPIPWREIDLGLTHGLYVASNASDKPDIIIFYCHGGGFSMGSAYFYLEFLMAWVSLLKEAGYSNPAIFGLEYTLVPNASYPTQLEQTTAGYDFVCSAAQDSSRVCVSGDSAGATLVLSLMLHIAKRSSEYAARRPGYACLISPWTTLYSPANRNTQSDYLNSESLHLYGRQYAGSDDNLKNPIVSPGVCRDGSWWAKASPSGGFGFIYGSEEVLGPELRELIAFLRRSGCAVTTREEPGAVHAWPVVTMFLSDTKGGRKKGLKDLIKLVTPAIPPALTNGHISL